MKMRSVMLFALGICMLSISVRATSAGDQPNVLFIAVDDLRPQMGCYGQSFMKTPNLDELASRGVVFERAYCMVPTCGASRAALMTSIRPARNRFINHLAWAQEDALGITTLNTHFKNNGYTTISLGKIFHHPEDELEGWSEKPWRPSGVEYQDKQGLRQAIEKEKRDRPNKKEYRGMPYENADAPETEYKDYKLASQAIEKLSSLASHPDQPFFLAVGFFKPHLPFVAPRKYWDLYERETIHLPDNYGPPENAPSEAVHNSGELRSYATIPGKGPVDDETALNLIHGYYACVSFTDAQIGRLLSALKENHLDENTMIVLWGDHGWQLGEHGMWNKHSCFETSMHAPLIFVAPNQSEIKPGTRVPALTEFIDVYPTLCDLASLPKPDHLQGETLVPLMKHPELPGKGYAVGRFMAGDTIRSDEYRYSEYSDKSANVYGRMIYDQKADPKETVNILDSAPKSILENLKEELDVRKGKDSSLTKVKPQTKDASETDE